MDAQEHVDSNALKDKAPGSRARKRSNGKAPTPAAAGKRSLNLRIDDDSYKRLSIHALMRDATISELVMEFAQSLRDFSMPHRLGGRADVVEQGVTDGR